MDNYKRIQNNLLLGLGVYALIGAILAIMLYSVFGSMILSVLLVLATVAVGYVSDFTNIHKTQTVTIINKATETVVGCATGEVIWMMFGVYRIDGIQDNTKQKITMELTNVVTADGLLLKKAYFDTYYKLQNIFTVEYEIGSDDIIEILTKKAQDAAEAGLKSMTLEKIESSAENEDLNKLLEKILKDFFKEKGYEYISTDFRGLETSDALNKSRELMEIEKNNQRQKDFTDAQFMNRVNMNYLSMVMRYVRNVSLDEVLAQAKSALPVIEDSPEARIKVVNKAVQIAEDKSNLPGKELRKIFNQALEDLNIKEGKVKKDIFENRGNGGAHPLINMRS